MEFLKNLFKKLLNKFLSCFSLAKKKKEFMPNQNAYTATSWENMPAPIKNIMGMYLLKPNIINTQSTSKQMIQALSKRKNMDLPYTNREKDNLLICCAAPWLGLKDVILETGKGASTCEDQCMCCLCAAGTFIFMCPLTSTVSAIGLFVDCVRAKKRQYDNDKDEAFHRKMVGPSSQMMK